MSGPVTASDSEALTVVDEAVACEVEVIEGRRAQVGGMEVRRVLPRRGRRTVGAWCFVDQMGPGSVTDEQGLDVGPHPHIGLQTVTWLLEGAIVHHDSLGSEQVIRPGELNLMTAGRGVAHSEETAGTYTGGLHGVQLWVAQPAQTRDGAAAFEHHGDLPQLEMDNGTATVIVGELLGAASPARRDTDHVGVDLDLRAGRTTVPIDAESEYGLVVLQGAVSVGPHRLEQGTMGYLGTGRDEVPIDAAEPARLLLIGGRPFPDQLLMWWNYVARDRDEITTAHRSWLAGDDRFGRVESTLPPIMTSGPPWS